MITPFYDKILIEPFVKESEIFSDTEAKIEAGKVIAIGSNVTFVKPGDILYFDSWGCSKTPLVDGKEHYLITEDSQVILGKSDGIATE